MTLLTLDVIDNAAALPALAEDWSRLWAASPTSTPFQHPAWMLSWWQVFGRDGEPRIATLRDGDARLLGLLPLYLLRAEDKLLPIGAGVTDLQDVLLAPDAPSDAASRLLRAALADRPCHLTELPPDAALRVAAIPDGWREEWLQVESCPVLQPIDVPATQRRKLRMARHRAERAGGWRVTTAQDLTGAYDTLRDLHAARWQQRGEAGVLADPDVAAFHRLALPALHAAGLLDLRELRIAGEVAGVVLALRARGTLYFYIGGFDPARAFESPGTLLIGAMLDGEDTLRAANFLRGSEPYKYAWGARDVFNAHRILQPV